MILPTEKNTENMKIHVSETLKRDLQVLAAMEGSDLSAYVRRVLELHAWGALNRIILPSSEGRRK